MQSYCIKALSHENLIKKGERILKAAREERRTFYKRMSISVTADFSSIKQKPEDNGIMSSRCWEKIIVNKKFYI